jgi:predicted nucleic acid binding AN1-type Zn finger protein
VKRTFIPNNFRPNVPGSKIDPLNKPRFLLQKNSSTLPQKIVLLSSKEDLVTKKVWNDLGSQSFAVHLCYDDLGYSWDFTFSEQILSILTHKGTIIPQSIYHRHPGVNEDHPCYSKHIALFEVMDIWKGNAIGQKRDHFQNTSKPFQAISSILHSIRSTENLQVAIPKTYLIKGDYKSFKGKLNGKFIVKSCSSMRSIAATNSDYCSWDFNTLKNIPVLFQEKIEGEDYRVHILDDITWSLAVSSKDHTDYRYSSKKALKYRPENLPISVKDFCKTLARIEGNRLIGVDFIKSMNKFFCLESNPGPGWSTFNHSSRMNFSKHFINTLKRKGYHEKNTPDFDMSS